MKSGIFAVSFCAISGVAIVGCSAAGGPRTEPNPATSDAGQGANTDGKVDSLMPVAVAPVVHLVHAATGLGDVRICFLPDSKPAQPSDVDIPQTNYAGLAVGSSVLFRDGSMLNGVNLAKPFAVTAEGLGEAEYGRTPFTCDELAKNPLINKIWIAPTTLETGAAAIVALVGCPAGVGDATRCGPTFDLTNGNLRFITVKVGGVVPNQPDQIGTFVSNLSPSVAAKLNGGMASSRLGAIESPCGAVNLEINRSALGVGQIAPSAVDVTQPVAFDAEGFAVCTDTSTPIVVRSYAALQAATVPTSLPAQHFQARSDYVFTIVGDTTVQEGPEAVHALAIRFDASN